MASIRVEVGNIGEADTDAVVSAAPTVAGEIVAGIALHLKQKGGRPMWQELLQKQPIPPGGAIATGPGYLKVKHVIHAAVMGEDLRASESLVGDGLRSALALAQELGVRSITIPALGTREGGLPLDVCAGIMVDEVQKHVRAAPQLEEVRFLLRYNDELQAFQQALSARQMPFLR